MILVNVVWDLLNIKAGLVHKYHPSVNGKQPHYMPVLFNAQICIFADNVPTQALNGCVSWIGIIDILQIGEGDSAISIGTVIYAGHLANGPLPRRSQPDR